jgi:hypothetical protein
MTEAFGKCCVKYRSDQKNVVDALRAKGQLDLAFQMFLDCVSEGKKGASERFSRDYNNRV